MAARLRRLGWLGANAAAGGVTAVVYAARRRARLARAPLASAPRWPLARRALGPGRDPQQSLRDTRRAPLRLSLRQPRLQRLPHQPARRLRHRARPRALAARSSAGSSRTAHSCGPGCATTTSASSSTADSSAGPALAIELPLLRARWQGHRRLSLRRRCARAVDDAGARPWHAYSDIPAGEEDRDEADVRAAWRSSAAGPTSCSAAPISSRICRDSMACCSIPSTPPTGSPCPKSTTAS